nr:hypothetical protein [Tanacetum cinerariifolium]
MYLLCAKLMTPKLDNDCNLQQGARVDVQPATSKLFRHKTKRTHVGANYQTNAPLLVVNKTTRTLCGADDVEGGDNEVVVVRGDDVAVVRWCGCNDGGSHGGVVGGDINDGKRGGDDVDRVDRSGVRRWGRGGVDRCGDIEVRWCDYDDGGSLGGVVGGGGKRGGDDVDPVDRR